MSEQFTISKGSMFTPLPFELSKSLPPSIAAQITQVAQDLTGTINKDEFMGFAPGVLMFLGCSGELLESKNWKLVFRFDESPYDKTQKDICSMYQEGDFNLLSPAIEA